MKPKYQDKKIFLIFNGRFPGEKASALFAAKTCEAYANQGVEVTLIAPRRLGRAKESYKTFYDMKGEFKTVFLPTLDLFRIPILSHVAFYISSFTFAISSFAYLFFKKDESIIVYSDFIFSLYLTSFIHKTFYELHDFPEKKKLLYKMLLKRIWKILATNTWKSEELQKRFGISKDKILVELNAVEIGEFNQITKQQARKNLGLSPKDKIVLYTGHFYSWKGVDTLAHTSQELPDASVYYLGGTKEDIKKFRAKHGVTADKAPGFLSHKMMPVWQAAADVLVLPNTGKEAISVHYTSPMKLFEYMASYRPIVASNLPSVREIVSDDSAILVMPDDPQALARGIKAAFDENKMKSKIAKAHEIVTEHTWEKRASRVLSFMSK
jgi:glycosyltransferase involved in cell wall biosynthesis